MLKHEGIDFAGPISYFRNGVWDVDYESPQDENMFFQLLYGRFILDVVMKC